MSKPENLIDAVCPDPEEWEKMSQSVFQRRVGCILGYLLERDQVKPGTNRAASFIGGVIGGIITVAGWFGLART